MEKQEYIKQLKRLIKKYHPDLCTDKNLESMYSRITIKLNNALNKLKNNDQNSIIKNYESISISENKNSIIKLKDRDYEYYKLGIKYYKNIHPDKFFKRNDDKTYETKSYEEQLAILNKIFISFNLSKYYFTKVIIEYSNSPWKEDALEKLKLLEKLYKYYENIEIRQDAQIIETERFTKEMGLKPMF